MRILAKLKGSAEPRLKTLVDAFNITTSSFVIFKKYASVSLKVMKIVKYLYFTYFIIIYGPIKTWNILKYFASIFEFAKKFSKLPRRMSNTSLTCFIGKKTFLCRGKTLLILVMGHECASKQTLTILFTLTCRLNCKKSIEIFFVNLAYIFTSYSDFLFGKTSPFVL
jgi:hypothetical protein